MEAAQASTQNNPYPEHAVLNMLKLADMEKQRAERLAAKLRELGVSPE